MNLHPHESVGWTLDGEEAYLPRVVLFPIPPGVTRNTVHTVTCVERC